MFQSKTGYKLLSGSHKRLMSGSNGLDADDTDTTEELRISNDREASMTNLPRKKSARSILLLATAANVALFIISVGVLGTSFKHTRQLFLNRGNSLLKKIDAYSPVYDQVEVPLLDLKINGTLLNTDHSVFRGPPSPELDAAWESITHQFPHVISAEDVIKLGKDPARTVKWPEEWGFGSDAYVGELDIVHTIHCLNAVRRDVHWRYYFADKYPDGVFSEVHLTHTDHCIYIILQNLMCSANGDMITNVWVDGQIPPFPDFSIQKKCRDFGALIDWHHRTQIDDEERYRTLRKPEGSYSYKMTGEFHRLFQTGFNEGQHNDHGSH